MASAPPKATPRFLPACNRALERATWGLTAVSAALFFGILVLAVVLRALNLPLRASEELSSLLFVWACFGGAALCLRREQHIRIQLISGRLGPLGRRRLRTGLRILTAGILLVILVTGAEMMVGLSATHMPISGLPQAVLYLPVVLFPAVMFSFNLEALLRPTPTDEEPC